MSEWLQTYNEMFGMYHAGIITTIFGAFAVTFTVLMSWPKLVKDFGPIGGFMAAALIIGTFWLVNHKLPGFGFSTGLLKEAFPRWVVIILGGIVGGIFVGLTGYTNAAL